MELFDPPLILGVAGFEAHPSFLLSFLPSFFSKSTMRVFVVAQLANMVD
jgi:hypothetical protein